MRKSKGHRYKSQSGHNRWLSDDSLKTSKMLSRFRKEKHGRIFVIKETNGELSFKNQKKKQMEILERRKKRKR